MIRRMRFALPSLAALALLLAACAPPPIGNPVGDFAPVTDTTIPGGDVAVDSITIPTGVTVTVEQGSTIDVAGDVAIEGDLVVDCEGLEMTISGDLTVNGAIDNRCDTGDAPGDLMLVVDGALTLGAPGATDPGLTSDGDIDITDSATQNESLDPLALTGDLRARGGAIAPSQGGAWEINAAPAPGRSGRVRITRAGDIDVNVDITAGDGSDGADQNIDGTCDASGERGGNGGTVSMAARDGTLTLAAGVTVTAGDGGAGGSCTAPSGCPANAIGGKGGRGGSVLVGGSNVVFGAGVTLVRGSGGPGGSATALADDGVGCLAAGCEASATGGEGGAAGGVGYVILEPGSIQGNPTEDGGDGGRGGDASALAGDGGDCDDCAIGGGGAGGNASANAGRGGDGASANIWPVAADSHKQGDGGDAEAIAGDGGAGADCCKFGTGGDGGDGGDANSVAGGPGAQGMNPGLDGTASGAGGDGGDGGDGETPGAGGAMGSGSGSPDDISDGVDGLPGEQCQFVVWWVYYSSIPDGVIVPGTAFDLQTYSNPNAIPGNVTGQVTSTFLDPQALTDLGFPTQSGQMYPFYQKVGDFVEIGADPLVGYAGFDIDLSGLQDFPVDGLELSLTPLQATAGTVILLGHGEGGEVIQTHEEQVPPNSEFALVRLPPPPPESGQSVYTHITVVTDFYFGFDHWWVVIIDP